MRFYLFPSRSLSLVWLTKQVHINCWGSSENTHSLNNYIRIYRSIDFLKTTVSTEELWHFVLLFIVHKRKGSISESDVMNVKHFIVKHIFKWWNMDRKNSEKAELAEELFPVLSSNYNIPGLQFVSLRIQRYSPKMCVPFNTTNPIFYHVNGILDPPPLKSV